MTKTCTECGQEFQPVRREQELCGVLCRNRRAGRHRKKPQPPCASCGKVLTGKARKYCSMQCRAEAQRLLPTQCPTCATTFQPRHRGHKFCSKGCADQAMVLQPKACESCGTTFQPKGSKSRFCSRNCAAKASGLAKRKGPHLSARGYVIEYMPEHPMAMRTGYIQQHRRVMAEHLGRLLGPDEVVHHRNEIKTDNRVENLEVLPKRVHDRIPKPAPKPIECPHCGGLIGVSGRVRTVVAL